MALKQPGLLTIIILVTGSFTILFIPGVYLLLGPRYLDNIYAGVIWLTSLLALIALLGFVLTRQTIRNVRSIRKEGWGLQKIAKCQICNTDLPPTRPSRLKRMHGPHYQSVHSIAWNWNQKWQLPWNLAMMIVMLLLILSPLILFYEYSHGSFLLAVFLPAAGILSWILLYQVRKRKINEFRRQWAAGFAADEQNATNW